MFSLKSLRRIHDCLPIIPMQTPVTSPAARKSDLLRRKHGLGFREALESLRDPGGDM